MAKARLYKCKACTHSWWERWEAGEGSKHVGCPECAKSQGTHGEPRVSMDGVAGKTSKAANIMQDMLEKDYGMTNLKDNLRQGDVAAMVDNPVAAESNKMGGMFSGAGIQPAGAAAPKGGMSSDALLAGARAYTAQSNREGRNPMNMFHAAAKKGLVPDTLAIAKQKAMRHNPNAKR